MSDKLSEQYNLKLEEDKNKLKLRLKEIFQIDSPDLNFGVYRIMNQKRDEITKYLDEELFKTVDKEFNDYDKIFDGEIQNENNIEMSVLHKAEIFAHLDQFFSRYYKDGDFLSLRRYSTNEKYAIPYNGEEVMLHWANKDQYYIKTDKYLKGHCFEIGEYNIIIEVVESEQEEQKNKDNRIFVLSEKGKNIEYYQDNNQLVIRLSLLNLSAEELKNKYPPKGKRNNPNTSDIADKIIDIVLSDDEIPKGLRTKLNQKENKSDSNEVLKKHLLNFMKESTSDFFIHKDLGGFLKQELDFFIKNEILRIDDLDENKMLSELYIKRIKIFKNIAINIIDFLAQIENYQKKLWEKKKFVLQTDYCITIDHIPEEFYEEICSNDTQVEEWKKLYALDDTGQQKLGNNNINVDFLKNHPYLVLDTAFYSDSFKENLLENLNNPDGTPVTDLDETIGGLMIKSENWQALNLLQERYKEQVKCVYIDPPYNTNASEILYKNNYKHSTWLSLLHDRLLISKIYLEKNSTIQVAIDDEENSYLKLLMNSIFGLENYVATIAIQHNPRGRSDAKHISPSHEYLHIYSMHSPDLTTNQFIQETKELNKKYPKRDSYSSYRELPFKRSGSNSRKSERENLYYPIYYSKLENELSLIKKNENFTEILPLDSNNEERVWRWESKTASDNFSSEFIIKNNSSGNYTLYVKDRLKEHIKPKSFWYGPKYDSSSHGTILLQNLFQDSKFTYPKSINALNDAIHIGTDTKCIVLDFFAGSGTTAHAVMNLNKKDNGKRKYILVEMGDYFHTVTKPRIQKVTYSSNWKKGKPQDSDGQSHIFKYMILESYEDTLDNIEFRDSKNTVQRSLFDMNDYMLRYFLDFETKDSPCWLKKDGIKKPFDYKMKVRHDLDFKNIPADKNGFREINVDLVETFNYLLGLHVVRRINREHNSQAYRFVHGTNTDNRLTTIVWRNYPEKPEDNQEELKEDSEFINRVICEEFPDTSVIYVNNDCFIKGAINIESEFKRLMGA